MEENGPPKTADRTNRNIQDLPEELRIRIFSILPLKDIVSVCLVCKKWNSLANSESLWKIKCNSLPANVERERLNDDEKGCRWKEIYKRNSWRTFHPDMFRNPAAYDDLPQGMFGNMDVDSVADVLQLSKRSS
eukprot:XP_011432862.1 PREDICTED: F-box only protein 2-like [Crassostrea gigas]